MDLKEAKLKYENRTIIKDGIILEVREVYQLGCWGNRAIEACLKCPIRKTSVRPGRLTIDELKDWTVVPSPWSGPPKVQMLRKYW